MCLIAVKIQQPKRSGGVKSLLRYNSLLCLCHLGYVLSLRSFKHTQTHCNMQERMHARVYVGRVLTHEMYTRVNLSGVNGFLNVRESHGMIKERCVIHRADDHCAVCCCSHSNKQPQSLCVFVQE